MKHFYVVVTRTVKKYMNMQERCFAFGEYQQNIWEEYAKRKCQQKISY